VVSYAGRLVAAGKKAAKAAEVGELRALRQVLANLVDIADEAGGAAARAAGGWTFVTEADEQAYFEDGRYERELLATARAADLALRPLDGALACFPSLIRINPSERAVAIDRKAYRQIRPTHLVAHLRSVQTRPRRINAGPFLESLHRAYELALARKKGQSRVVSLDDLYKILTLLPTAKRDYSQPAQVAKILEQVPSGTVPLFLAEVEADPALREAFPAVRIIEMSAMEAAWN
jgi:hypothetical protein